MANDPSPEDHPDPTPADLDPGALRVEDEPATGRGEDPSEAASGGGDDTRRDAPPSEGADPPRRQFLQATGSVVLGGAVLACPAAVGLFAVSAPLREAGGGGLMVRLTNVDALPEDGTPQIFKVVADKVDAWTTHKDLPLGLVFASRGADGKVTVFSASCPHAGCAVEYRKTDDIGAHYYCPCHESYFHIDGSIGNDDSPARRGLDSFELDEEKLADGEVWIRFQKFKAGVAEKKAVS